MLFSVILLCWSPISYGMTPPPGPFQGKSDGGGDVAFPDDLKIKDNFYHSHHHHHHRPDFHPDFQPEVHHPYHQNYYGNEHKVFENSSRQIPLDFIQNINQYNVSDLLLRFVDGDTDDENEEPYLASRFGDGEERNAAVMPKEAGCMPELTTVKVASSDDPSVLYIPQCTRVERCGGCCSHALLSCQPQQTETISYKVLKTQYTGGKKLKLVGKEVVLVEKHTKCKCDCRVKAQDCNRYQQYRQSECRCVCANLDEEKKCYKNNNTKLWNPDLCACQCREVTQCSTGYSFDQNECRCVPVTIRRRNASLYRAEPEPEPVVPLFEDENN